MEVDLELVLVPAPGLSQFAAQIELARQLAAHNPRISVVVIIVNVPIGDTRLDSYYKTLVADADKCSLHPRITVIHLPEVEEAVAAAKDAVENMLELLSTLTEIYKPMIKDIVRERSGSRRVGGFILEQFCGGVADVAEELGVPYYFFYACNASVLAFKLHFESIGGHLPPTPYLEVPGFKNPVPETAWPAALKNGKDSPLFQRNTKRLLGSKGILPNTFTELEPDIIASLSSNPKLPSIYPIGPVVNVDVRNSDSTSTAVLSWLQAQPPKSVVFLSFGTIGAFNVEQVNEIAAGLEQSGYRFLWTLKPSPGMKSALPEGFLKRTEGVGRVVEWAPQREVLAHPAVGAFVSHCGWNSMMESLCAGVPVAAWPLFAEQQLNAYQWVVEYGLATEMRIDYVCDPFQRKANVLVEAAEVERGIRRVMEEETRVRKRVAEMSQIANKAPSEGGSSHRNIGRFIQDVINNLSA